MVVGGAYHGNFTMGNLLVVPGNGNGTFSGQAYTATDTLVKYTWNGDTDFSGSVDFDDYVRIDVGFKASGDKAAKVELDLMEPIDPAGKPVATLGMPRPFARRSVVNTKPRGIARKLHAVTPSRPWC